MFNVVEAKSKYLESLSKKRQTVTTTEFAKDYGMSAVAMNKILVKLGILKKAGRTYAIVEEWRFPVYFRYRGYGYSSNKEFLSPRWTHEGMEYLYHKLKEEKGLLPLIERNEKSK